MVETSHVQEQHAGIFHHRLDLAKESDRFSAVDESVVVGQRHVHHGPDLNLPRQREKVWNGIKSVEGLCDRCASGR